MTLPPVRALGKTREGGKKKKTPMDREGCGGEIMWMSTCAYVCMCVRDTEREEEEKKGKEKREEKCRSK